MHRYSARSLGTAPPLTAVRAAGVLGQETGEGISAGGRGSLYVETVCGRSDEPPSSFCQQCGGGGGPRRWMLVCPPVVAVVCRLVDLRLLLNGGVLAALSSATLLRQEKSQSLSQMPTVTTCTQTCIYVHMESFFVLLLLSKSTKFVP